MAGLIQRNRGRIPLIGDMVFSILTIPLCLNYFERWAEDVKNVGVPNLWFCAFFAALGIARVFHAFGQRERSRALFIANLVYGVAFVSLAALEMAFGNVRAIRIAIGTVFWGSLISNRVISIFRRRRPWNTVLNVIAILPLLAMIGIVDDPSTMIFIVMASLIITFVSALSVTFARIKLDLLKEIVRKTYALEIISGLLLLIVVFAYALRLTDDAFTTFGDGLWYCFAVVTTIGYGDLTPATTLGRILSVILGIYGIIVVALITSIIVNFYSEMKKVDANEHAGASDSGGDATQDG